MAAKAKKKTVTKTDYVACRVQLTAQGVKLEFDPPYLQSGDKHHYSKQGYEGLVAGKRGANPAPAGGQPSSVPNGRFDRDQHKHTLSYDRPTRLAFYLDAGTTWRFVGKGVQGKSAADKKRFTGQTISVNGRVAEVTFKAPKKKKNYGYELWLQADVVGVNQANQGERPSVTVIIDPIVGGTGGIPP